MRRQVLLSMQARGRVMGLPPWVAFGAWVAMCSAQEASTLRSSGVALREPAAWCAAAALWFIFASPKYWLREPMLVRFAVLASTLIVLALATTASLSVADVLAAGPAAGLRNWPSAAWFVLGLAPVALAFALPPATASHHSRVCTRCCVAMSLGPAAMVASAAWRPTDPRLLIVATVLSICASLLQMIANGGEPTTGSAARNLT